MNLAGQGMGQIGGMILVDEKKDNKLKVANTKQLKIEVD